MKSQSREQFGRVGVLMGGVSSERAISLKSGKAVIDALNRLACQVVALDIIDETQEKILLLLQQADIDLAFNCLHGQLGEDGRIQSILEKANIAYTGSGIEASRLAFNKTVTQNLLKKNDISIPPYVTLCKKDQVDVPTVISGLGNFPVIVKPACEGSSVGITLVRVKDQLEEALQSAWNYDETLLIEKYIVGRELTVGILGQQALPVVEICPKQDFFTFDAKYTKGLTDYMVPAGIPDALSQELKRVALKVYHILGCTDLSRVDFMLDADNNYYVLELNTIPGFTSTSLLPMAAGKIGLTFDQLCYQLLEYAHGKKKEIKNTTIR